MKKLLVSSFTLILSFSAMSLLAEQNMNEGDMQRMGSMAETSEQVTVHSGKGTVKKIDTSAKLVTLSHEPIESLEWPAMTMGFAVEDVLLLNKLSVDDLHSSRHYYLQRCS